MIVARGLGRGPAVGAIVAAGFGIVELTEPTVVVLQPASIGQGGYARASDREGFALVRNWRPEQPYEYPTAHRERGAQVSVVDSGQQILVAPQVAPAFDNEARVRQIVARLAAEREALERAASDAQAEHRLEMQHQFDEDAVIAILLAELA